MDKFKKIKQEYQAILQQLSDPELVSNWEKGEELLKRKVYLEKIIEKEKELKEIKDRTEENKSIISAGEDKELISLAETELSQLKDKENALEKELREFLTEDEKSEQPKAVMVEIRAGTGGEEAALFVADLFKMYSKYAQTQGWKQKVLDSRPAGLGGLKEIIFELSGSQVFSKMKSEGGVHRVQRIPETEKSGRIHTSTASVAVLVKPKKAEIKIKPEDLKIDREGFVDLDELFAKLRKRYDISWSFIEEIMSEESGKRFEIIGNRIRSLYGHSIEVTMELEEDRSAAMLYHGTTLESALKILNDGLKPMQRKWVHLSPTKEIAFEVGRRRTFEPVVLMIDAKEARKDGVIFFKATERVFLCREVPAEHIHVLDVR